MYAAIRVLPPPQECFNAVGIYYVLMHAGRLRRRPQVKGFGERWRVQRFIMQYLQPATRDREAHDEGLHG